MQAQVWEAPHWQSIEFIESISGQTRAGVAKSSHYK